MDERKVPQSRTPEEKKAPRVSKVKKVAAGIPAVVSTMKHGIGRMGVLRTVKTLRTVNQMEGFDCPGCAWPDPEGHRTSFEFCENGAKAVADEATKKRIGAKFFEKYSIQELSQKSDQWLNAQGRLIQPMFLPKGQNNYRTIEWNEAFEMIKEKLVSLNDANRAAFYTSGRTSNEAAFLYQLFVRRFGTNNLPDCSNMCHESSGKALGETMGIGKGTVTLDDFNHADLIIVMGQNPGTNHPRMLTALRDAKRNGARIIHVNPLPETGLVSFKHPQDFMKLRFGKENLADLFLQVRINGDAALLKGIMKVLLDKSAMDFDFIEKYTSGFQQLQSSLQETDWDDIIKDSGLSREEIEQAAEMCAESKATIACWAMGLTQHKNGVATIQEVVNLLLLGGHVGRKGAGTCPVRGHSNVQGDRTMGIWEKPSDKFLDRMEEAVGFKMPRQHGLDVVDSIAAMRDRKIDFFFCMGGNFLSASPDTEATAAALNKVEFTVQVSTKLNRSHLVTGKEALILPCLGRTERDIQNGTEQFVTVENSMGVVHMSRGGLKPASENLYSEVRIICGIADSLFPEALNWKDLSDDYDKIRDLISNAISGFENYNERVRTLGGFHLANPPRDNREFHTKDGKAKFTSHPLPNVDVSPGNLVMMTIRSHDQYNTTIYDSSDRYRGIKNGRRLILLNSKDMDERGINDRQKVDITSLWEGEERHAKGFHAIRYDIPRGCAATYFPEANVLVPLKSIAVKSNTPTSKFVEISIKPVS